MRLIIFLFSVLFIFGNCFAEEVPKIPSKDKKQVEILLHEEMMKSHQQAAACLKAGNSEEECQSLFYETCNSSCGPDSCGHWRMHKRGSKK